MPIDKHSTDTERFIVLAGSALRETNRTPIQYDDDGVSAWMVFTACILGLLAALVLAVID